MRVVVCIFEKLKVKTTINKGCTSDAQKSSNGY